MRLNSLAMENRIHERFTCPAPYLALARVAITGGPRSISNSAPPFVAGPGKTDSRILISSRIPRTSFLRT